MLAIITGFIGIVVGFFMTLKPRWFLEMMGEQRWAIKVFGPGHGTTAYKVVGIVLIIVSFMIMTGLMKILLIKFFTPIT